MLSINYRLFQAYCIMIKYNYFNVTIFPGAQEPSVGFVSKFSSKKMKNENLFENKIYGWLKRNGSLSFVFSLDRWALSQYKVFPGGLVLFYNDTTETTWKT